MFERFGSLQLPREARPLLAAFLAVVMVAFFAIDTAEAQNKERRVQFTLSLETSSLEGNPELRVRRAQEMAAIAAERIETRLNSIDIKNHRVRVNDSNQIDITVYGLHSPEAIKSAIIPAGRLEIRPVLADNSIWLDLEDSLPEQIEIKYDPASFQTDRIFLFSPSARSLRDFLSRVSLGSTDVVLFPHQQGWRTLNLGPTLATHSDITGVELHQTPSAIPFVKANLSAEATDKIRTHATAENVRHLVLILDGEPVHLYRFSQTQFSDELNLQTPDFLRTTDARYHWAIQVVARLSTPLPVTLIEIED